MNNQQHEQPMGLWRQVREDLAAHGDITAPGFHAIAVHRLGVWRLRLPKWARWPFTLLYYPLSLVVRNVYGIEMNSSTRIGRRVKIGHQSGIVLSHKAVIGDDCLIRQNVTIGAARGQRGAPVLGNRVDVGAGAVIIGDITIGDDAQIGPNAVVMVSVPAGATAFAPPAKVMQLRKFKRAPETLKQVGGESQEAPRRPEANLCPASPPV